MEYLIDCACRHDLTRHDSEGCRAAGGTCRCRRTKIQALDAAIEQARVNPWAIYLREPVAGDDPEDRASA